MKPVGRLDHLIVVGLPGGETWLQSVKNSSFVDDRNFHRTKLWFPGSFGHSTKRCARSLGGAPVPSKSKFDLFVYPACFPHLTPQGSRSSKVFRTAPHYHP